MGTSLENWKEDLEKRVPEEVNPSKAEVDAVMESVAAKMDDFEDINPAEQSTERPIAEIRKEVEAEGWHFCGSAADENVFMAVMQGQREIRRVGARDGSYLFDREPRGD